MRVISLDTTTRAGSAALVEEDRVVDVRVGDASRDHAERLPSELIALVADHGLSFADVDVFAVASGPGSFTGLRIGIATIQGLAVATGRRVVAVPALDALAHGAGAALTADRDVVAWMDARRRDVFSAAFRVTAAAPFDPDRLVTLKAAQVGPPSAVLEALRSIVAPSAVVFTGDGAVLYEDEIRRACPSAVVVASQPIAGVIGLLAAARARRGETVDPAAIQPLYVRRPDAVIAREARG